MAGQGDCFVGGLVACGIAPQMIGTPNSTRQISRIKYWLELFRAHGQATESSVTALHYPDVFLVGLEGGTRQPPAAGAGPSYGPSYGLYYGAGAGSAVSVRLPASVGEGATLLTFQGDGAPHVNLTLGAGPTFARRLTFFAANNLTLVSRGAFWQGTGGVTQTLIAPDGARGQPTRLPPTARGHTLALCLGEYVVFERSPS